MQDYLQHPKLELQRLQRRLDRAETALEQLRRPRESKRDLERQVRWCVTVNVGGSYPTAGANVYPIVFLDADFTAAAGTQTFNSSQRSTTPTYALCKSGRYLPEGTSLPCFWQRGLGAEDAGDWWLIDQSTVRGVAVKNISGSTLGPHAVMNPVGQTLIGSTLYVEVFKVEQILKPLWLINGPNALLNNGTNTEATWALDAAAPVAIDAGAAGMDIGRELGPKPTATTLFTYRQGFLTQGGSYISNGLLVIDCLQRRVDEVYGKLKEDLDLANNPAGDVSAEFEIWYRGSDMKLAPAGWFPIDVYPFWLNKNEKVQKGTKGRAYYFSDYWEGDFACDPDDTDTAQQAPGANQEQFVFQGSPTSGSTQFAGSGALGTGTGTL